MILFILSKGEKTQIYKILTPQNRGKQIKDSQKKAKDAHSPGTGIPKQTVNLFPQLNTTL